MNQVHFFKISFRHGRTTVQIANDQKRILTGDAAASLKVPDCLYRISAAPDQPALWQSRLMPVPTAAALEKAGFFAIEDYDRVEKISQTRAEVAAEIAAEEEAAAQGTPSE